MGIMITKKHFIQIAREIALKPIEEREYLINFLCPILKSFNPNFDNATFIKFIEKESLKNDY
jgi:hypothetical protein